MAKPVYHAYSEALAYEKQIEQLPDLPARPMLFDSDYPKGDLASEAQAKFQFQQRENEYQQRAALSGYLARPWEDCGAQTPQERELEQDRAAELRRYQFGLPDSPPGDPPRVGDRR